MDSGEMTRRELFHSSTIVFAGMMGASSILNSVSMAAQPEPQKKPLKLIDEQKNVTAKSLKFVHDATKSQVRKNTQSNCSNCQMYRMKGAVDGVEVGVCNMIGGGYVKSTGWCTSWVRDPKRLKG